MLLSQRDGDGDGKLDLSASGASIRPAALACHALPHCIERARSFAKTHPRGRWLPDTRPEPRGLPVQSRRLRGVSSARTRGRLRDLDADVRSLWRPRRRGAREPQLHGQGPSSYSRSCACSPTPSRPGPVRTGPTREGPACIEGVAPRLIRCPTSENLVFAASCRCGSRHHRRVLLSPAPQCGERKVVSCIPDRARSRARARPRRPAPGIRPTMLLDGAATLWLRRRVPSRPGSRRGRHYTRRHSTARTANP